MTTYLKNLVNPLINCSGIIIFIFLWEMLPHLGVIDKQFFPPLSQVLLFLWKLTVNGTLFLHISASLQRIFIGLALAIAVAVPGGCILGAFFPGLYRKLMPLFRVFEQINALPLSLIFILFFGIGEIVKVFIIFWSTIWPILFTTIKGVQHVDPLYIKSARAFGAGKVDLFRKVIFPGAAPTIFSGIRAGASYAFFILIAAEAMGANFGLGRLIRSSAFGACIVIAVLDMTLIYLLHWLESNLFAWRRTLASEEAKCSVK